MYPCRRLAAIGEAAHLHLTEDCDETPLVARFHGAAGDTVSTAQRTEAFLAFGAQVQVVLIELAQQLETVCGQALLELGVGEPHRLGVFEEADKVRVATLRRRQGACQLRRLSWATSASSPALASASSF